jgi:hypothetical protein
LRVIMQMDIITGFKRAFSQVRYPRFCRLILN